MTKTTLRLATLAAALAFGLATVAPLTASAATTGQTHMHKSHVAAKKKMMKKKGGSASTKSVQDALNKQGASLTVDGKMGPKTKAALKSFQQSKGLKATGKLDKATKAALGLS